MAAHRASRRPHVGAYELVRRIGSGGMGTLYLAHRHGAAWFVRPMALKLMHPHLAEDPEFVRRFHQEARLTASVTHPNVVHVEEHGCVDGVWFLAMELVDGTSLAALSTALGRSGRVLDLALVSFLVGSIADGLHAAHEARGRDDRPLGIVHCDVSPHNVLLSRCGLVKLADFGVATSTFIDVDRGTTTDGAIRGKVAYMAPEQAMARPVDRRADVYALGIVLWELLTQRRLFVAQDLGGLLDRVRSPVVPPPSCFAPHVPPELDRIVLRALARRPEDRFATARSLREQLERVAPRVVARAELGALVREVVRDTERERAPASVSTAPLPESGVSRRIAHETRRPDPFADLDEVAGRQVADTNHAATRVAPHASRDDAGDAAPRAVSGETLAAHRSHDSETRPRMRLSWRLVVLVVVAWATGWLTRDACRPNDSSDRSITGLVGIPSTAR